MPFPPKPFLIIYLQLFDLSVEIDESMFGNKRKYNRLRSICGLLINVGNVSVMCR